MGERLARSSHERQQTGERSMEIGPLHNQKPPPAPEKPAAEPKTEKAKEDTPRDTVELSDNARRMLAEMADEARARVAVQRYLRRQCPVCEYDLTGTLTENGILRCPECGFTIRTSSDPAPAE